MTKRFTDDQERAIVVAADRLADAACLVIEKHAAALRTEDLFWVLEAIRTELKPALAAYDAEASTGIVAVDRDRLARLVEFAAAALAWEAADDPWNPDAREATKPRPFAARVALRAGDTEAVG